MTDMLTVQDLRKEKEIEARVHDLDVIRDDVKAGGKSYATSEMMAGLWDLLNDQFRARVIYQEEAANFHPQSDAFVEIARKNEIAFSLGSAACEAFTAVLLRKKIEDEDEQIVRDVLALRVTGQTDPMLDALSGLRAALIKGQPRVALWGLQEGKRLMESGYAEDRGNGLGLSLYILMQGDAPKMTHDGIYAAQAVETLVRDPKICGASQKEKIIGDLLDARGDLAPSVLLSLRQLEVEMPDAQRRGIDKVIGRLISQAEKIEPKQEAPVRGGLRVVPKTEAFKK